MPILNPHDLQILQTSGLGEVLNASPLASGANNDIILLEFQTFQAVLKITRANGIKRLQQEHATLFTLNGLHSPKPLFLGNDPETAKEYLLLEYIKGDHTHSLTPTQAKQLGAALNKVHSLDITQFQPHLESPSWEEYYNSRLLTQLERASTKAPQAQIQAMHQNLDALFAFGKSLESKLDSSQKRLVHTDIIPLNIIFNEQGCSIIDWELARIDFPEWDICSVEKSFQFSELSKAQFNESYCVTLDPDRLRLFSLMQYANVALWRLCSFYCLGENHAIKDKFLSELEQELVWISQHLI